MDTSWLSSIDLWLSGLRRKPLAALAAAIACVLIATIIRFALGPVLDHVTPFIAFFPALLLAGYIGGISIGLTAALLSALIGWYVFLPPVYSFELQSTGFAAVLTYLLVSAIIAVVSGMLANTIDRLQAERTRAESYLARSLENEGHVERINAELRHRIKNLFGVVDGLMNQTAYHTPDSRKLVSAVSGRLHAMSRALDLAASNRFEFADLNDVAERVLDSLAPPGPARLAISGASARCTPETASNFALALHELATNALKHGAWRTVEGRVTLTWTIKTVETGAADALITWCESSAEPISAPNGRGFGLQLLTRLVPRDQVRLDFQPTGLVVELRLPCIAGVGGAESPATADVSGLAPAPNTREPART